MKLKMFSLSFALFFSLCIGIVNSETSSSNAMSSPNVTTYTHGMG